MMSDITWLLKSSIRMSESGLIQSKRSGSLMEAWSNNGVWRDAGLTAGREWG